MTQPNPQENGQVRVRFAAGETDEMPLDMAEFIMRKLYGQRRDIFARYAGEYWKTRHGPGRIEPKTPK